MDSGDGWRGDSRSDFAEVTVTEYRPGGPPDGRLVGSVNIPWRAIRERAAQPTTTTASLPPATTAPTTTAAASSTTTRPPAVTIPPPDPVAEVPYGVRDVVVHWFHHPGLRSVVLYVADPDGPIPLELDADGERWMPAFYRPRIRTYTPGGQPRTYESAWVAVYLTDHPGSGFAPVSLSVDDHGVSEVIVDISTYVYDNDDGEEERVERHSFRSISFVQVEPPSSKCAARWRRSPRAWGVFHNQNQYYSAVLGYPDCYPSEWAEWWGVRATYRETAASE